MNLTLERPLERERCSSCDAKLWRRPVSIGDEVACKGCLRYILQNSLEAETSFPPRWAGKRLDPRDFRHVVSSEFLDEYEEKEKEWGCPARLRLYCHHTTPPQVEPCGNFLRQSPEDRLCQRCDKCMTYTCGQCHMNLLSQDTRLTQTVIEAWRSKHVNRRSQDWSAAKTTRTVQQKPANDASNSRPPAIA